MTTHERRRLSVLVSSAAAVVILGAVLITTQADRLGPGRIQRASSLDTKIGLAWALHGEGATVDTVILGNSTADCGLDPDIIAACSDGRISSFNGALPGYDYEVHRPLLQRVYVPLLAPEHVVLAVSMMDANRNERGFRRNVEELIASPQWPLYLGYRRTNLHGLLFRHVAIYRYGLTLQHALKQILKAEARPHPRGVSRGTGTADPGAPLRGEVLAHFHSFTIGGHSFDSLAGLLRDLRAAGRDRLVVNMPLSPRLFRELPGIEQHYQEYATALRALAMTSGAHYVNAHGALALPASAFSDEYHLNDAGRRALSELVAGELSGACVGERPGAGDARCSTEPRP